MIKNARSRVALGMSGGVDSSLSAHLLSEQGYDVTGVYLECWRAPGCRTEEDRKDALKVALELGIPFQVLDFKQEYKDRVVEYFFQEYAAGRTPNPDVMCNKEIKFGMFYDWAMNEGFDYIATGHYARIVGSGQRATVIPIARSAEGSLSTNRRIGMTGPFYLTTSRDVKKDQTYFLYRLRAEQLEHILFPIGHLTKSEVRTEATKRGVAVADKPDSQGICFIGEINVHNFLKERLGENPGDVINTSGEVMGKHTGLWFYTVGQRHGFEISGTYKSKLGDVKHSMPPYYVIRKIPENNQLVVGFGPETFREELWVEDIHWIDDSGQPLVSSVRIRHGGKIIPVEEFSFVSGKKDTMIIRLSEPLQGVAEGQSAVFYRQTTAVPGEYRCVGGGIIL